MTHQAPSPSASPAADPGRQVARLREAQRLVEHLAGYATADGRDALLDEAAKVSDAYERALPVVQRRFDALAEETAGWAAAGVEALMAAGRIAPAPAAAAQLAYRIETALSELAALFHQAGHRYRPSPGATPSP